MAKAKAKETISSMVETMKSKFDTIIVDAGKFDAGNKSAGSRVRNKK